MEKHMKECFSPHSLLHSLFGLGLGVLLSQYIGIFSGQQAVTSAVVIMLAAFAGDYYLMSKKK